MLKIPTFRGFHGPFSPILHCYASDLRYTSIHLSTWHRCMAPRRFWSLSQACSVSWRFRFFDLDYMFTAAAGCWVKPWGMLGETPGTSRERDCIDVLTAAEPQVWCTAWAWCWRILHPAMVNILTSMAESRWCDFPTAAPHILKFDSNHCAHPQCHWAREQGHGLQTVLGYWDHSHFSTLAVTTVSDAVLVHPLATFHVSFRSATFSYAYMACVTLVDADHRTLKCMKCMHFATSPTSMGNFACWLRSSTFALLLVKCGWSSKASVRPGPWPVVLKGWHHFNGEIALGHGALSDGSHKQLKNDPFASCAAQSLNGYKLWCQVGWVLASQLLGLASIDLH